ncbi:MAG: chemotaxis response regulator protein-glutamate methylesterase [Methylotenera sp.]|nr:chemotaxis response regulator protein-glutamate methylesterase [Oligoflexia bacterium]
MSQSARLRLSTPAAAVAERPKKVLVVDDSKTIRELLTKILSSDPELQVVACAELPSQVEDLIRRHQPDVITLDIHMPEMDGVTLLRQYLPKYPVPTVMITSISMEESTQVLTALESGAVDYIQKPSFQELARVAPLIIEKVKTAAQVRLKTRAQLLSSKSSTVRHASQMYQDGMIVAIGSSTGGTEALKVVLTQLPEKIPPILVVQHIPAVFSKAFADRLNQLCPFEVKEAQDGDEVLPNQVLIAPGGLQMSLIRSGPGLRVKIEDSAPVNRHKPSVDVLFDSVAELVGKRAVGVILTGMGADGSKGLLKMRNAGARTIAQDQESCVVFGMPAEAIKLGAACEVHSLNVISGAMLKFLRRQSAA